MSKPIAVHLPLVLLLFGSPLGCISVHYNGTEGKHHVLGLALQTEQQANEGARCVATSPGLSIRFCSSSPGFSLGWHEETVFLTTTPKTQKVAVHHSSIGIGFQSDSFYVGYIRQFGIQVPVGKGSCIQEFHYSEADPDRTIIRREALGE